MKNLFVPKISIDTSDTELIDTILSEQPEHRINILNWANLYPAKPEVSFRIIHNGDSLILRYDVHENEILAAITEDNGKVYTDSCVECFISFDKGQHYYNTEASCIGKVLMSYRIAGHKAEYATPEVLQQIVRLPSLGTDNKSKEQGDFNWNLTLIIHRTAYWQSNISSFDGLCASVNFYKCGDQLTIPHYLSWNPINIPDPSFHRPDFFGHILFEN